MGLIAKPSTDAAPSRSLLATPWRSAFRALLASLLVGLATACSGGGSEPVRGIVLITLDTTRMDRLSCYGDAAPSTPAIDRLADTGYRFTHAISSASQTLPSHAAILSGAYPHVHGARSNGVYRLSDDVLTLPEIFADRGYATAAFVSAVVLEARYGLDQGFDVYDDEMEDPLVVDGPNRLEEELDALQRAGVDTGYFWHTARKYEEYQRRAASVTTRALAWLADTGDEPFFLWTHYFDPHGPYDPPEEFATAAGGGARGQTDPSFDRRRLPHYQLLPGLTTYGDFLEAYHGEIRYTDSQIGRLLEGLESLGLADSTLIVLTADHGESLDENGYYFQHGDFVFDSELRVPLLIRPPGGLPASRDITPIVSTVDVFPTLLELAGLPDAPPAPSGRSIVPAMEARHFEERPVYSEAYIAEVVKSGDVYRSLRTRSTKLMALGTLETDSPRAWAYDLVNDPREASPIAFTQASAVRREEMDSMLAELRRIASLPAIPNEESHVPLDDERRRQLEALGYLEPRDDGPK